MIIQNIKLFQFNNYTTAQVSWHSDMNVIVGLNGMGKTNMLDAIFYLCLGKSYHNVYDRYIVKQDCDGFRMEGFFMEEGSREQMIVKVLLGKSKELTKSGKPISRISDFIGTFPCVIVTPLDIQLMLDGSAERRKFINNTIMQYDQHYAVHVMKYNRVLKQRNALLKSFLEKGRSDKVLLESVTEPIYESAQYIYERRQMMIEELSPLFSGYYQKISDDREQCKIGYRSKLKDHPMKALIAESLEKDLIMGRTTVGIHKDDISFSMNGRQLKNFASQGQLKSFVLALKLAQYDLLQKKKNRKPILLLDDIFDKLDRHRVAHLIDIVGAEPFGQVFITDTSMNRIADILDEEAKEYHLYEVDQGIITHKNV